MYKAYKIIRQHRKFTLCISKVAIPSHKNNLFKKWIPKAKIKTEIPEQRGLTSKRFLISVILFP